MVVRNVDGPDLPIQDAFVTVAPIGLRPVAIPNNLTRADGAVTFEVFNWTDVVVRVRRVGYVEAQLVAHLRSGCRHVLEIYISQEWTVLDRASPPRTPARATLSICAPPA